MTEQDYINVAELTRIRIAYAVLSEVTPALLTAAPIAGEYRVVMRMLNAWIEQLQPLVADLDEPPARSR